MCGKKQNKKAGRRLFLTSLAMLLSCSTFLHTQTRQIDSIKAVLNKGREDTTRVNDLNALEVELYNNNLYASADSAADSAVQLSKRLNFGEGLGMAYGNLGTVCCMQGRYAEGLKNYNLALKINEDIGYGAGMARTHGNIGVAYYQQGKYPEALQEELISLKFEEGRGNKLSTADQCGNVGNIYLQMGNYKDALKVFTRSLTLYTQIGNKAGIASAYGNIGNVYQDEGIDTEAIKCQQKALEINKEIGNQAGIGNAYANIGGIYYGEGKYDEASKNEMLAMQQFHRVNDAENLGAVAEIIASNFIKQKKFTEARQYLDSALAFTKITGSKSGMRDIYYDRSTLDSSAGNYKQAMADYAQFINYRNDIYNEANTKKLVTEQLNYEFDKKLAAQKEDQEKKDAIAEVGKKKQIIITVSISLVLLLVVGFSGLLFSRYRVTQRQKKIIEQQKQVVEEKNKDILDSITYAKHLQDAILPPMNVIKTYLPDAFVLYKPKDIVAGDFYWLEKTNDRVFVAACDCTGHGVPGAMVSVVCSNALNRAVKEFKITEPGKILDKARELVLETFEKSEGDIKDGMDISLASLTPSKVGIEVQWSGAYNPLWYVQGGQLHEVEADKQPIGKTDNPKPYTTHTIKLNSPLEGREAGVCIYLFTDGYADQFGGPKGKKFKYKQFQEKLIAISHKPLAEQKQELESTFESWKGGLEQVDDVLVMGIRV